MTIATIELIEQVAPQQDETPVRPRTRAECRHGIRPCPWSCRYNLNFGTNEHGDVVVRAADRQVVIPNDAPQAEFDAVVDGAMETWSEDEPSCALDVIEANPDGMTLEPIAELLRLTRERVRQLQLAARTKLATRDDVRALDTLEVANG